MASSDPALDRPAQEQLRADRDKRLRNFLERETLALAENPRLDGCLKLAGHKDHWRVGGGRLADRLPDRGRAAGGDRGARCAEEWAVWVGVGGACEHAATLTCPWSVPKQKGHQADSEPRFP
jgi:hypothetical protein